LGYAVRSDQVEKSDLSATINIGPGAELVRKAACLVPDYPLFNDHPTLGEGFPQPRGWPAGPVESWIDDDAPFAHPPSFDDSVRLAADLTGSPMAAVSILGEHYQWFKAKYAIPLRGTTREVSFCRFTVQQDDVFVVPDATLDPRFATNPLVVGHHNVRAYAGAPLIMADGEHIGAVCVLDTQPRTFGEREQQILELLARQVVSQLQLEQLIHRQACDIDDLEIARAEMRHMAMHDDLTGLQNRRGVIRALEQVFTSPHPSVQAAWAQGVSLLYLDLDDFKRINDIRGHDFGDRVLVEVAARLTRELPSHQVLGRLGGDEFIMMVRGNGPQEVAPIAERILQAVRRPMTIEGERLVVDASIGLAAAERFWTVPELIDHADQAMYDAKQSGGSRIALWSKEIAATDAEARMANKFVRTCLDGDRIEVHFQPMFDLAHGEMIRREALLRWRGNSPAGLSVEGFIEASESAGVIGQVGDSVLRQACAAAAGWQSFEPGVGVSVNVSALQVVPDLCAAVADALGSSGLSPHLLTLELTESCILERTEQSLSVLNALSKLGVRLALDDFGTGYASMSMLCAFPLDEVKIDRRFCSDPNESTVKVVRATIELGHSLGLCVVAEGIETHQMLAQLMSCGCDVGQGYLLGRPGPIEAALT